MAIERQLPKRHGTHEANGEVRVLWTITAPQPISYHHQPHHATSPQSCCTPSPLLSAHLSHEFLPLFWKGCAFSYPSGCLCLYGLYPLPPRFSPLSSGIISRSGQLAPAPVQVKCYVICLPWEHDFPSDCSQHLTVLLGCGWKYPESRNCPFLCVSVFAVPIPDKVCWTSDAGCEGVLSSHCLCPSASIMPPFCISFWSAFYFFCP